MIFKSCRDRSNPVRWACILALATAATVCTQARAQTTAPSATKTPLGATRPAEPGQPQTVTITGIEGLVQVRAGDGQPWEPAKLGMVLGVGAEFRTGTRSAVRFVIPPDQVATLDRLGTVKVLTAIRSAKRVKTDLGMKYGRVRYDIEGGGVEHESTIYSPGATLAVRGTKVSLTNEPPFVPAAASLTGRAQFATDGHPTTPLGGHAFAQADASHPGGAASFSFNQTINPAGGVPTDALTSTELNQWGQYPAVGTTLNTQILQATRSAQNSSLLPSPSIPAPATSDNLIFYLLAQGLSNTNVDLAVTTPGGQALGPAGGPAFNGHSLVTSAAGGTYVAIPNPSVLTSGIAPGYALLSIVGWSSAAPHGTYSYGAADVGTTPVNVRLYVYTNGAFSAPFTATASPRAGYVSTQVVH